MARVENANSMRLLLNSLPDRDLALCRRGRSGDDMKFGMLFPREIGPDPTSAVAFVRAVEKAGFSFLTTFEHVLGADISDRPNWSGPYNNEADFHEPFVFYGYLAALTKLELATGVLVLPQRQTALVAKQATEVDILTGGNFRLGVAVGWNAVEYDGLRHCPLRAAASASKNRSSCCVSFGRRRASSFSGRFDQIDLCRNSPHFPSSVRFRFGWAGSCSGDQ